MQNAAKRMDTASPVLEYAKVRAVSGDHVVLLADFGDIHAERAAGCLLAPRPGDLVLASVDAGGHAFVLSVLKREAEAPGEIAYPGDLRLRADGDLRLDAGGEAALSAKETLTLAAKEGEAAFEKASLLAKTAEARFKTLTMMAGAVEQFFSRLTQRLTNSVKLVEEHEEVQAGSARYLIEDTLTMHSKNAVHIAEEVAKIDAGEVHLG